MRLFLLISLVLFCNCSYCATITICSWNLKDFGRSKSDEEINFIADVLKQYDVIAIQEVVAGYGGPQAVARLADQLNRKGSKWDYTVSEPTTGTGSKQERYAFIWKTSTIKRKGMAWLERRYNVEIEREPFYLPITHEGKPVTLVNFHAITKSLQPETEVKYFKFLPSSYPGQTLLFVGDFNLPQSHTVFNPLKSMGYLPALVKQKTSLKMTCIEDDCLASEFDNMFVDRNKIKLVKSGIVRFYKSFTDFATARLISDHVPVFAEIEIY